MFLNLNVKLKIKSLLFFAQLECFQVWLGDLHFMCCCKYSWQLTTASH